MPGILVFMASEEIDFPEIFSVFCLMNWHWRRMNQIPFFYCGYCRSFYPVCSSPVFGVDGLIFYPHRTSVFPSNICIRSFEKGLYPLSYDISCSLWLEKCKWKFEHDMSEEKRSFKSTALKRRQDSLTKLLWSLWRQQQVHVRQLLQHHNLLQCHRLF